MKKTWLTLLLTLCLTLPVWAQSTYVYSKQAGTSAVFAWDGSPMEYNCGTQTFTLTKGQASLTCDGRTYPLVWTGEDVKIVGGKEGGDVIVTKQYGFQGVSLASPNTILTQGATKATQVTIPLTFGTGRFRLKVNVTQTWDGVDKASAFADSDGPNGTVDGVARPWVVEVTPATCTSFTYSEWTPAVCPANGIQTRTVLTSLPAGCAGGVPVLSQTCLPITPPPAQGIRNMRVLP